MGHVSNFCMLQQQVCKKELFSTGAESGDLLPACLPPHMVVTYSRVMEASSKQGKICSITLGLRCSCISAGKLDPSFLKQALLQ